MTTSHLHKTISNWKERKAIEILLNYEWECKTVQHEWKSISNFLKTSKMQLPYDLISNKCGKLELRDTYIQNL